jgi:hypothetical protein
MKYIYLFFISTITAAVIYYTTVISLIRAPIQAEYWVSELITVKDYLLRHYTGKPRIIIAGGSSTLFGIDADYASKQLHTPVFNYGLHAGMRLEDLLDDTRDVVAPGDTLILALEPQYFRAPSHFNAWDLSNIIAWENSAWQKMSFIKKAQFVTSISPDFLENMMIAEKIKIRTPDNIDYRLMALDNKLVISKFINRKPLTAFAYSAYNIDDHGDMLLNNGAQYTGFVIDARFPLQVDPDVNAQGGKSLL